MSKPKLRVVFLHLDLGIGGAEQLVVNAALALKQKGHSVQIVTSHFDEDHCFAPTKPGGELHRHISVVGDFLPRRVFGKFTALCGIVRMALLALVVVAQRSRYDVVFCDGISAQLPIFFFANLPVYFYCHFPDKLLCVERTSFLKRAYRTVVDWLEEVTTGCANVIAVNSKFTAKVFQESFSVLGHRVNPAVLYPAIDLSLFQASGSAVLDYLPDDKTVFVSLNRYERKKRIDLAVHAFAALDRDISDRAVLVIAGGYDPDVRENVEHLKELQTIVEQAKLSNRVIFRCSISDGERVALIRSATALVYTPDREHFGIVPVESMYCETPVIAVASGGPLETVVHESTGFLCDQSPQAFADAMTRIVLDAKLAPRMGAKGKQRVEQLFTFASFGTVLEDQMYQAYAREQQSRVREFALNAAIITIASLMLSGLVLSIVFFVAANKMLM